MTSSIWIAPTVTDNVNNTTSPVSNELNSTSGRVHIVGSVLGGCTTATTTRAFDEKSDGREPQVLSLHLPSCLSPSCLLWLMKSLWPSAAFLKFGPAAVWIASIFVGAASSSSFGRGVTFSSVSLRFSLLFWLRATPLPLFTLISSLISVRGRHLSLFLHALLYAPQSD